jgi:ABC-type uncharacterized transport system YnjBCD permease subunit
MWVFAILALIVGALVLVIVAMLIGPIVGPLYEIVVNDPAVQEVGFDVGAEVAMRIGAKYVLPLIGLSLVIWFLVLRLASDTRSNVYRR